MQTFDAPHTEAAIHRKFPAYGPIEAILGYVLFYVLVEKTTTPKCTHHPISHRLLRTTFHPY
jgi:hypothetical protein